MSTRRTRRKRRAVRERAERRAAQNAREAANLLRAGVHHAPMFPLPRRELDMAVAAGALSVGDPVVFVSGYNLIRRAQPSELSGLTVIGIVKSIHNKIPGPSTATVVLK